jgi:hypothetical protein
MLRLLKPSLILRHASTAAPKDRWDMCVGVLIERLPVVSRKFNEIETEMMVRIQYFDSKCDFSSNLIQENTQSNRVRDQLEK